jgi:hypothetical protein
MAVATGAGRDVFEDSLNENNGKYIITQYKFFSTEIVSIRFHLLTGFEIDYDAETSAFTNECKEFMNKFVSKIFAGRC